MANGIAPGLAVGTCTLCRTRTGIFTYLTLHGINIDTILCLPCLQAMGIARDLHKVKRLARALVPEYYSEED